MQALKIWNQGKEMWCIPKKGTEEYDEVIAIMENNPQPRPRKRARTR
jgi:hypothetical protein